MLKTSIKELYDKIPHPLKTEHNWRYSDYSLFFKDSQPDTNIKVNSLNLNIKNHDLFDSLIIKYPEKISLFNLLNYSQNFSVEISESNFYQLSYEFLGSYNITRSQINIKPNVEVDLLITSMDKIQNSVNNNVIEINVEQNSKLKIFFDHYFNNSFFHNFVYLNISDNADVRLVFKTFYPKYEKNHIKCLINGIDSNLTIFILAKLDNIDHVDYRTENIHLKSNSKSLSVYRSIANGKSTSIYTGMLRIEKDAKYCNAYQNSRNILLSEKAKVQTIPELEILNQEVSCTHGAVVSSIDEESIYYFMSRGVSREEAIKLITDGFLIDKLEENFGKNLYPEIYKKITEKEYEEIELCG